MVNIDSGIRVHTSGDIRVNTGGAIRVDTGGDSDVTSADALVGDWRWTRGFQHPQRSLYSSSCTKLMLLSQIPCCELTNSFLAPVKKKKVYSCADENLSALAAWLAFSFVTDLGSSSKLFRKLHLLASVPQPSYPLVVEDLAIPPRPSKTYSHQFYPIPTT